ncbi:hypothetical protein BH20ACT18_BH20ACT18_06140 [soil metagenome]
MISASTYIQAPRQEFGCPLSHHLKVLREAVIVDSEQRGLSGLLPFDKSAPARRA